MTDRPHPKNSPNMIEKLKALLFAESADRRLSGLMPEPAVAVCALLLEAAESDKQLSADERRLISTMLRERFQLSLQEVESLIQRTQQQRSQVPDVWPFTHYLRQAYTPEQKRELLVMVWEVILEDGLLDPYEDQWAHRLQEMVAVNHSELMTAKRIARERLEGAKGLALAPA